MPTCWLGLHIPKVPLMISETLHGVSLCLLTPASPDAPPVTSEQRGKRAFDFWEEVKGMWSWKSVPRFSQNKVLVHEMADIWVQSWFVILPCTGHLFFLFQIPLLKMETILTSHKDVVGTGCLMIGWYFENIKYKISARSRKPKTCGFSNEVAGCACLSFCFKHPKEIHF